MLSRRQYSELQPLLALVPQEGFPILEQITLYHLGEYAAVRYRQSGYSRYDTYFGSAHGYYFVLGGLEHERDQQVKAGTQCAGLHTYLIMQCYGTAVRHLLAKPAPLYRDELIAMGDLYAAFKNDQQYYY